MDMLTPHLMRVAVRMCFAPVRVMVGVPPLLDEQQQPPDPQPDQGNPNSQLRISFKGRVEFQVKQQDERAQRDDGDRVADRPTKPKPRALDRVRFERNEVGDRAHMVAIKRMAHAQHQAGQEKEDRLERRHLFVRVGVGALVCCERVNAQTHERFIRYAACQPQFR